MAFFYRSPSLSFPDVEVSPDSVLRGGRKTAEGGKEKASRRSERTTEERGGRKI